MVQGEEASCSWRMASAHDHAVHLSHQAAFAYHGGLQLQPHHHAASAAPPASFLYYHCSAPSLFPFPLQNFPPSSRDFQPAAVYFGELEEALIHGANAGVADHLHHHPGGMIAGDAHAKLAAAGGGGGGGGGGGYLAGAGRPPTLEIFPSWPMPHPQPQPQQLHSAGNSQSVGSTTDSSSARNTMAQMELVSPGPAGSVRPSPSSTTSEQQQLHQQQRQEVMMVTTDDYSYKPGLPPPAAAGLAAAAPSFQPHHQHHHQPQLHGGGDHDKRKHGSTRKDGKVVDSKTERRLAQNREAAKKSRLRKKAYVQNLETSRVRLQQMEQELQRARSQGIFLGGCGAGGDMSPGAAMFDMEYARWLDDDGKRLAELRGGLQAHLADSNLGAAVEECMQHYDELFQLKAELARSDVFHLLTGAWATPAERCFFWMGGFRPSELLKILIGQLDPLTEQQMMGICGLQHSSEQAEEALAQGLQQLHQSLADTVGAGTLSDGTPGPNYMGIMAIALEKLASLESFYQQADNLRQQTLHQMRRILTTRQAARCFLSIGEYYRRLRALSSLWASRPRDNFIGTESLSPTGTELQGLQHHHQPQQNQFSGF